MTQTRLVRSLLVRLPCSPTPAPPARVPQTDVTCHAQFTQSSSSSSTAGPASASNKANGRSTRAWVLPAAAVAVLGGTAALAPIYSSQWSQGLALPPNDASKEASTQSLQPWVQQLAEEEGMLEVVTAARMQEHPFLGGDHMFAMLLRTGMVSNMACYYEAKRRRFHCIVQLGQGTSGYRGIVHGGLTAAILDETLGLMFFALKRSGALPFWGPAFTAHLEVDYKAKLPTGKGVLCTAEVESIQGRKVWMTASVRDGPHEGSTTYATARALFVAPAPHKLLQEGIKHAWSGFFA